VQRPPQRAGRVGRVRAAHLHVFGTEWVVCCRVFLAASFVDPVRGRRRVRVHAERALMSGHVLGQGSGRRPAAWGAMVGFVWGAVMCAGAGSVPHAATPGLPRPAPATGRSGLDSAPRLQILRREQSGTGLEWLDTTSANAARPQGSGERPSPFEPHAGLAHAHDGRGKSYSIVSYSADGRFLARVQTPQAGSSAQTGGPVISVVDTGSGQLLFSAAGHSAADTVHGVSFSPGGSYLVVCSRFRPSNGNPSDVDASVWTVRGEGASDGPAKEVETGDDAGANNNLAIWHLGSASLAGAWCTHYHWDPDRWPYIQWRAEEDMCAWAQPGALNVLRRWPCSLASEPALIKQVASMPLASPEPCVFALAPFKLRGSAGASTKQIDQATLKLAVFKAEAGGRQLEILDYETSKIAGQEDEGRWTSVIALGLEGAEDVSLKWSPDGSALVVLSTTHVDDTNQNYYGTTRLHLLRRSKNAKRLGEGGAQGEGQEGQEGQAADGGGSVAAWEAQAVTLDRPGPIHDAAWSPTANDLIVVYGTMPAKSVLYNRNAQPVFSFGTS